MLHFVLSTSTDVVCERISAAFSAFLIMSFLSHMPTFLPYSPTSSPVGSFVVHCSPAIADGVFVGCAATDGAAFTLACTQLDAIPVGVDGIGGGGILS